MANVAFDTQLLTQAQAAMDVAHAECAQLQSAMNQFNADLMAPSNWSGTAAGTFNGVYAEFTANYSKVNAGLQQMQENLLSAARTLGVNEQAVQSSATKLGNMINNSINTALPS